MSENFSNLGEKRLMIASFVEPTELGRQFDVWPLHVTLLSWFHMDRAEAEAKLDIAVADMKNFNIALGKTAIKTLGDIELFGKNADVTVRRIVEPTSLDVMHGRLLGDFYHELEDMSYVAGNYIPHVTVFKNNDPGTGAVIKIDNLSLVEYDKSQKTVIRNYNLNNETTT